MTVFEGEVGSRAAGGVVGHVRVLPGVESPQLGNRRDVQVYLPPSYAASGRHYSVIYMHDGQNLFDAATSFAGEWHVDETMERLAAEGVEAIVVAVPNMGRARTDEYSPFVDLHRGGGRGDAYLSFLVDTLKPGIDRQFRTRREPDYTGLIGSSMGGLISLYGFLHRKDVFGFCGAMSPSLWFAGGALYRYVETVPRWAGRLYLDTGTAEGRLQVRNGRMMARLLRRRARHPRRDFKYIEERGAGHNEAAWSARFERAVRFLLPRQRDTHW
jgi:predicted alpha/beta superfamily hydrolase